MSDHAVVGLAVLLATVFSVAVGIALVNFAFSRLKAASRTGSQVKIKKRAW